MPETFQAVLTNDARRYWPLSWGKQGISAGVTSPGVAWNPLIRSFKIGEGGFILQGATQLQRPPDAGLRWPVSIDSLAVSGEHAFVGSAEVGPYYASLARLPIKPSTLRLYVGGIEYGTDDGSGLVIGAHLDSGTIDYASGGLSATFAAGYAPAVGVEATVNYTPRSYPQDVDAVVDALRAVEGVPTRYAANRRAYAEIALDPAVSCSFVSPSRVRISCTIPAGVFVENPISHAVPKMCELGVFCDHPMVAKLPGSHGYEAKLMVLYCTFPEVLRTPAQDQTFVVSCDFGVSVLRPVLPMGEDAVIDGNVYGSTHVSAHGLTGMLAGHVGKHVNIAGATDPKNNGIFAILQVNSETSIVYENPLGATNLLGTEIGILWYLAD